MNDSFTCRICFELHTATAKPIDRRPSKICNEYDHLLCSTCAKYFDKCPTCQKPKKLELLKECTKIAAKLERLNSILNETGAPEIPAEYFKLAALPFASGSYADVYNVWQNQSIALKLLRRNIMTTDLSHKVLQETRSAMALSHPNIVRVFGVVSIDGSKGILMEKADRGSLRSALDATNKLSLDQLVSVSIDVVDGFEYMHSKKIFHRAFKSENVLLFDVKSHLTSKIADFGTSKVIQSSLAGTDIVGTPYYTAPELLKPPRHELRYGWKVDLYSLSIVLYEVFSGRNIGDAFASVENSTQLLEYIESGQRPELPESFPTELRAVVERGWSSDANARSTLISFREALCRLKTSIRYAKPAPRPISGPNASAIIASTSTSADTGTDTDTDACATFEARLQELHQSVKAYKLTDARTQVAACASLFAVLRDRTTATASTAQYHSVKGYVHHWFGEYPDAYKETYQALTELYELSVSGVSVEDEQVGRIVRYAVEVCEAQNWYKAMAVLLTYGVRFAKSKLSDEAYADMLECFCLSWHRGEKWKKIAELLLATRLKASENKPEPHINVAIAHYHMAAVLYQEHLKSDKNFTATTDHLKEAKKVINQVDSLNIWAAACKSLKGLVKYRTTIPGGLERVSKKFEDARNIAERILGKNNHTVALILFRLALSKEGRGEAEFKTAIKSIENSLCPNSWLLPDALRHLADLYSNKLHRFYDAEDLYLQAVDIRKDLNGPSSEQVSRVYDLLAKACKNSDQKKKADTYTRLKSEVDNKRQKDETKSIPSGTNELTIDESKPLESGNEAGEAPGELVDALRKFFEVAPKPQPQAL